MSYLGCLYEITDLFTSASRPRDSVARAMEILTANTGLAEGNVGFINPATGQLDKEEVFPDNGIRGAIVRRVLSGGAPVIVPLEEETVDEGDGAVYFICVPIKSGHKTLGAVSVDRQYYKGIDLEEDLQLLTVLSGIFLQAASETGSASGCSAEHLPGLTQSPAGSEEPFASQVEAFEKSIIIRALEKARGNQTKAAAELGTSLRIINYKIGKYLIDYRPFRKIGK